MNQTLTLNPAGTLILPREIIKRYKTSKFSLTPLDGALVLEPEYDNSPTYALTEDEEQKLETAIQEDSLPIENLKRN